MIAGRDVGSLHWFVESLRRDVEVLSHSLVEPAGPSPTADKHGSAGDFAA